MLNSFKDLNLKNIKLDLSIMKNEEKDRMEGLKIKFNPIHEDLIYYKSDGTPVGYFPLKLEIKLDLQSLIRLNALFLEIISSYLFDMRKEYTDNHYYQEYIHSKIDEKRYIRVGVSKYFFREEEKGRYKINISIFKKGRGKIKDIEVININFTKRDILVLTQIIKRMISSSPTNIVYSLYGEYVDRETNEIINDARFTLIKMENSIGIDGIWLHGQELLNLMHTTHSLIYKLHIEEKLHQIYFNYRQLQVSQKENVDKGLYLSLKKANSNHELVYTNYLDKECYVRLPFNNDLLSALFLFLDINILKHSEYEDQVSLKLGKEVKYHISTKESSLGIAVLPPNSRVSKKEKDEDKLNASRLLLVGKTNEGAFLEENDFGEEIPNYIKVYNEHNEPKLIPVLTSFRIDLRDHWFKLVKGLSLAFTKEYTEKGFSKISYKFYVYNKTHKGHFKYQFKILSDPENKAPAVLIIDQFLIRNKKEELVARFRQPLFLKYLYELISICLAAATDVSTIEWVELYPKQELAPYKFTSMKKIVELEDSKKEKQSKWGIKKIEEDVILGNFSSGSLNNYLVLKDIEFLNISSYFRIMNKMWLPFVSEHVGIGQDGYITDCYTEVDMERKMEKSFFKGIDAAINLYFTTAIKEEMYYENNFS